MHCDVTKPDSVAAAVKFAADEYGRLDIMVNNAGVLLEAQMDVPTPLHETDVAVFDTTMAVNVRGVWLGMRYAIAQMLAQPAHPSGDRGWIINMSSIYGLVASKGTSSYSGSKGAVTSMTKAAALEYAAHKIHVNSIHPGYCETALLENLRGKHGVGVQDSWAQLHPWGRITWPEDVAKIAVFAAGDGVAFVTGHRKCLHLIWSG